MEGGLFDQGNLKADQPEAKASNLPTGLFDDSDDEKELREQ
jgi:hypothetical protein